MRRWLERAGVRPGLVLCSGAARTRQTLELVRPALGSPEIQSDERLYLASGEDLLQQVRALPDAVAEAMLVGHNPGLHDLALLLVDERGRAELSEKLPTGALVTLDLPASSWTEVVEAEATLVSFVMPRDL